MKKKTLIGICAAVAAFIAILLVATFYDLQINIALGNADSIFGQVFRLFGESTGWLLIPIAAGFLLRASDRKTKAGIVLTVVWSVVLVVGWYLTLNYFLEQFTGKSYIEGLYGTPYRALIVYSVIFALMFSAVHAWCVFRISDATAKKLVFYAIVLLLALAISQLFTEVMKRIWTRQRFRNLDVGNGGTSSEGFTPWYHPNLGKNKAAATYYVEDSAGMPLKDAYKSFPSGHTSAAALSLTAIVLPELFEKLKKYKVWFWVLPILYTVAVAISRIVNRAHYLSDVLFGGTIGVLSVFAAIALTKLFQRKEKANKFFAACARVMGASSDEPAPAEETEEPAEEVKEEPIEETKEEQAE